MTEASVLLLRVATILDDWDQLHDGDGRSTVATCGNVSAAIRHAVNIYSKQAMHENAHAPNRTKNHE